MVTFTGLNVKLSANKTSEIKLYARLASREGGAVYGDILSINFSAAGPLEFTADADGMTSGENDLGTSVSPYYVYQNLPSHLTVRYTGLAVGGSVGQPTWAYRDAEAPALVFEVKSEPEGAARIRRLTFKLVPSDSGTKDPQNDAIEMWPSINGDFADDDGVITLRRLFDSGSEIIGEGTNAAIRLSEVHGGTKDDTPLGIVSQSGDYALIEMTFPDGGEYFIPAGTAVKFRLDAYTAAFSGDKDYILTSELLGGGSFLWTDIPVGNFTPLDGGAATFSGASNTMTIKH